MTLQRSETMPLTRQQSLQLLQDANVELPTIDIGGTTLRSFLCRAESLAPSERQLAFAETATRSCIQLLESLITLYPAFEEELWLSFSTAESLKSVMGSLLRPTTKVEYAMSKYHEYLRAMFKKSGKTRSQFYDEMLLEASIAIELGSIDFGPSASAFQEEALMSLHAEHLLVFYSVELFLKAYMAAHPKDTPMSDEKIEQVYRHFEAAIPLTEAFEEYAKEDGLFKFSAARRVLPLIK